MMWPGEKKVLADSVTGLVPFKVTVISRTGTMQTLWLPSSADGRYRFSEHSELELPIYFEAESDHWTAHLEEQAVFYTGNDELKSELQLFDEMIITVRSRDGEFALYAENAVQKDNVFLPYYVEDKSEYVIGRDPNSHIYYANDTVSWKHAVLFWDCNDCSLVDCDSTNGTYLNGKRLRGRSKLVNGDVIYIMGLYILIGPGFIAMNNSNSRVELQTPKIRVIGSEKDRLYKQPVKTGGNGNLFDRQPRKRVKIEPEAISIDMPPMSLSANKIPFLLRMGSPMVMGGRAVMTGNYLMALTSLVFPALTQGLTEKDRKEYEERRSIGYREYLADKEREIYQEKAKEERLLNSCYPTISRTLAFTQAKDRLWERRQCDDDFLMLRLGTGQIPLIAEREYTKKSFELDRDVLQEEMYALAERPVYLENVPIMLSLKNNHIVGVRGLSRDNVTVLRHLIMQLVVTHSYDEVKLVLLSNTQFAADFDFVRYLPHNWDNDRTTRFFAENPVDAQEISEYLSREIEKLLDKERGQASAKATVSYVVLALSKELFDCVESLKDVLSHGEYCGVSIIAAFSGIPKECSSVIELNNRPRLIDLSGEKEDQDFQSEQTNETEMWASMHEVMRTRLMIGDHAYALPGLVTFLEMFKAGRVEHLNPLRRWAENDPVKSLAVPIGVGTDGRLFTLDLHEKRQGPHGLVAGMTGSGKSEFIITYILSMAVNFSPDEVAFILIDYKGGGLADAFENKERGIHLPHLVGTITNLDGASIDRSLMSIKSELTRRQTVFKNVKAQIGEGTLDIYDYQRLYRNKKVEAPMPHLFIISDEFAELKQQQPAFMDELISAARIGRSLGVHLILATQKPGGVVNNQIWSNTKFRACLRVQDRGDSMEMLKRPEAAELKQTGRFYLQVGYNEYFALGQSAWCGADYVPQDEVKEERDDSIQFIDDTGQTILSVRPKVEKQQAESRQIVAVVKYLSDLAGRERIESKSLWTEPLPEKLDLGRLLEQTQTPRGAEITALIGMVDDPQYQCQFPLLLNLLELHNIAVVGSAGSGKSTFVRTMLYSLLRQCAPEQVNYYIVDLSDGALSSYSRVPHCGAYLTDRDASDLGRLMELINGIIRRRKALFAEADATNYEAYCRIRPIPLILFIVDGFTRIKNLDGGDRFFTKFTDYLRDGSNFGIRFVVTCNHISEVGMQSRQEIDYRIALQAKDHYEYGDILGVRCKTSPPEINGRGLCAYEGRPLAYQVAMLDCDKEELDRARLLRERLDEIARQYAGHAGAERLPMVDFEQPYEAFCAGFAPGRIPLGFSTRDMKPVAIPFQQLHSMSLFFGNAKGVKPVLANLLTAAQKNGMDIFIVRRSSESVFENAEGERLTFLDCTVEGLSNLAETILSEIAARNILRDEYSVEHGIPLTSKGRPKKAAKYIRAKSRPILVLFESFMDFCSVEMDEEMQGKYVVFLSMMKWYNIYFAAGFYSTDEPKPNHPLMVCYNKEELMFLFGGKYDKIPFKGVPYEITKHDKIDRAYNQCLMKYQDAFHPLVMPCGKLQEQTEDPDDAPIM